MGTRRLLSLVIVLAACGPGHSDRDPSPVQLDGGTCGAGLTACGIRCVNPLLDNTNCGVCGTVCPAGTNCQSGHCTGAAGNNCGAGQTRCGSACVYLQSDAQNCGACGAACGDGQSCDGCACSAPGASCPQGQADCGGVCADLTMDIANCGACANACAQGEKCAAGQCAGPQGGNGGNGGNAGTAGCADTVTCLNACNPNDQTCPKTCVNAASPAAQMLLDAVFACLDGACPPMNGGVCDQAAKNYSAAACNNCYSAAQANGGKCAAPIQACLADRKGGGGCAKGQITCNGACVDPASDVANCGQCGVACGRGQMCQAGVCAGGNGGGQMTGCNGAVACINGCNPGDAACEKACVANTTMVGQQLLQSLLACLDGACPSTNGGVCDSLGRHYNAQNCDACYQTAQDIGGTCHKKLSACTSNVP